MPGSGVKLRRLVPGEVTPWLAPPAEPGYAARDRPAPRSGRAALSTIDQDEEVFPAPEFVRRGPPVSVRDLERAQAEKWARVMAVVPEPQGEVGGRRRHAFVARGPFTLPMATRSKGVDLGSHDAWRFYTHPYSVFPPEVAFYNVPARGVLGARLHVRGRGGVRLYDEVGAGLPDAEMVTDSYFAALGVVRHRALGKGEVTLPYARDLLDLDLLVLELFRLTTLLMRPQNPLGALRELHAILEEPSLRWCVEDVFERDELEAVEALATSERMDAVQATAVAARFRVDEADFTQIADVRDEKGRQAISELLTEYQSFEAEHGDRIRELSLGIAEAEAKIEAIKQQILARQKEEAGKSRLTRFFSRGQQTIAELKAEGVHAIRTKRALEAAFDEVPGYHKVKGLTERVQGFQATIKAIYRLACTFFEHNVTAEQLKNMRSIVAQKIDSGDADQVKAGWKSYDLRLRADVLPRVLQTYSLSAYVLRRPDALTRGHSLRNVQRINRLARHVIEYFRYVRYGPKTLGEAFDETWGQVLALEARLR